MDELSVPYRPNLEAQIVDPSDALDRSAPGREIATSDEDAAPTAKYRCAGSKRKPPQCDYEAVTFWLGRCPRCGQRYDALPIGRDTDLKNAPINLGMARDAPRREYISTGIPELDKVFGGGLVLGCTYLISGPRGTGKSTLLTQVCGGFVKSCGHTVFYASGEDNQEGMFAYAQRLGVFDEKIGLFGDPSNVDIDLVLEQATQLKAKLIILDSIQTAEFSDIETEAGNQAQMNAVAQMLTSHAKKHKIAIIIISHLNKDGETIKVSTTVEHLVDLIMLINHHPPIPNRRGHANRAAKKIRVLSISEKSRLGDADVIGMLEMTAEGMLPLSDSLRKLVFDYELAQNAEEDDENDE